MRLILLVALIVVSFYACTGECAYCPNFHCYVSSDCGTGCFCAKQNGAVDGVCMSGG